jgi:hypothetical protein
MKKFFKCLLGLFLFLFLHTAINAQSLFPCKGLFYLTRYNAAATNTFFGNIDFVPNDINITNTGSLNPQGLYNGSVQYNGYIWAQDYVSVTTANKLSLRRFDRNLNSVLLDVTGGNLPTNFDVQFNNAGVDKNGIMYLLDYTAVNATGTITPKLYAIDLKTNPLQMVAGFPKNTTGLNNGADVIWGDITVDPTTNRVYAWYHPTSNNINNNPIGLYEIKNINTATPLLEKVGAAQNATVGSLFFNERGQMFGYGSVGVGNVQDRFYAIDKINGLLTQYGLPDSTVAGSDGCECVFRLSFDRRVYPPVLNIPKCKVDTFTYDFSLRNTTPITINDVEIFDTLDNRFSYGTTAAAIAAQLNNVLGTTSVNVTITNFGGGVNNRLYISGINVPPGLFNFQTKVVIDASALTTSFIASEQAWIKNLDPIYGGPFEKSNDPSTYAATDATEISINLLGSNCLPPISNSFINKPIPQGATFTNIANLSSSDPDGFISNYKIESTMPATEATLRYCTSANAPCSGGFAAITAGTILTPQQINYIQINPTPGFVGNTQFTFSATDNAGVISNIAVFTVPIYQQKPVANNIMANSIANTAPITDLLACSFADQDAANLQTILVKTLPPTTQGVLSVSCPLTFTSATCTNNLQTLTSTVLAAYPNGIPLTIAQATNLKFTPTASYVGNSTFTFAVVDVAGYQSNIAQYTIPVTAVPTNTRPPLANNIRAQQINNSLPATAIPNLTASDLDGTITSFTIVSVPNTTIGVVKIPCTNNPLGGTCTNGFYDLTASVVSANNNAIPITLSQASGLLFAPSGAATGNTSFTFTATDNTNLQSNVAVYELITYNEVPKVSNIQITANFNGTAAPIVPINGSDYEGAITSFRLKSLPPTIAGDLFVPCTGATPPHIGGTCTNGQQKLTNTILANYPNGIPITLPQAAGMRYDPLDGYSGTTTFNYTAIDDNNNESTIGQYTIAVANQNPLVRDTINTVLANTDGLTKLSSNLLALDLDGTVNSFTIFAVPIANSGTLYTPCGGVYPTPSWGTCTGGYMAITPSIVLANPGGIVLTPAQAANLAFDPNLYFTGIVDFNYFAKDNSGNSSNMGVYSIPLSGVGALSPISTNITAPAVLATNAIVNLPKLIGIDPDGTVTSFKINTLSDSYRGTLSMPCGTAANPTPTGGTCLAGRVNITNTILANYPENELPLSLTQAEGLRFLPQPNYTGNFNFTYFAVDNTGANSLITAYTIPITGTPPNAFPINAAPVLLNAGPTPMAAMQATDNDGTIAEYLIDFLPPAFKGTFSISCPTTLLGTNCINNYQNLNNAMLQTYPTGIPLTPLQMTSLRFAPAGTFEGNVILNYHVKDNSGLLSNTTAYNTYIRGVFPYSNDVVGPKIFNGLGQTAITPLNTVDADGSINSYFLHNLPLPNQGELFIPCGSTANPTPLSATCTNGLAKLTAAVLANYPNGIPITLTQNQGLLFDPTSGYNGDVLFNFSGRDNLSNLSNVATYTLRVGRFSALPVTLLNFSGVRTGNDIKTFWAVSNETSIANYVVEYSFNGTNFFTGPTTSATTTNIVQKNYFALLINLPQPIVYLRLKIISTTGSVTYSNTIIINNKTSSTPTITPNPATNFINLNFNNTVKNNYLVQVYDAKGAKLYSNTFANTLPNTIINLNKSSINIFTAGLYVITVTQTSNNQQWATKIIFE